MKNVVLFVEIIFLYTESGSWVHLEAWVTDREMELKETNNVTPCPKSCNRCSESCPTKSLSAPYTMSPTECISFLTTFGGRDLPRCMPYEQRKMER